MNYGKNRSALREATAERHAALDSLVGQVRSIDGYAVYVRGIHAFRRDIEVGVTPVHGWMPTCISAEAASDLNDLALNALAEEVFAPAENTSASLGRAYVLEGSGLGARMLLRSANALGFHESFGARHLTRQASAHSNWNTLIALLEHADVNIDAAIAEAVLTFERVYAAMQTAALKAANE
jgi:heme oxygenase